MTLTGKSVIAPRSRTPHMVQELPPNVRVSAERLIAEARWCAEHSGEFPAGHIRVVRGVSYWPLWHVYLDGQLVGRLTSLEANTI